MRYVWIIPFVPLAGAALNGLFGTKFFSKALVGLIACGSMAVALLLSGVSFAGLLRLPADARVYNVDGFTWIPSIPAVLADGHLGSFQAPWGVRLDPLSGMMILVVTGVGFLIHVYSIGYMHEDRGYARFFAYLNLFVFFMLTLVLANNFLLMFIGWEGVGLCSYLLIGFWYEKKSASDAGKKAFVVNRIGDWGFILAMLLVFLTFGTFDFASVAQAAAEMPVEAAHFGVLSTICILLFMGATGKSAQIPLYTWLPDAMEGPTPVSALIHAATMVTAGVYMVGRTAALFAHAPMVMGVVAGIGAATAIVSASIGLVQFDIKRVLAYSTVSQLGYMFLAMGVGAFAAGVFHLMTHAFFKALLFLGAGSVIHGLAGEQDMRHMGGLKRYLPTTYWTMLVGALAIAGIPGLSGFFSKDEILFRTLSSPQGSRLLWIIGAVTALMTAFYMFRLIFLTFHGRFRGAPVGSAAHGHAIDPEHEVTHTVADGLHPVPTPGHGSGHGPHESPRVMTVPLIVLALGAVFAGYVGVPRMLGGVNRIERFLEPSFTAERIAAPGVAELPGTVQREEPRAAASPGRSYEGRESAAASPALEWGLMSISAVIAFLGLGVAYIFYEARPYIPGQLSKTFAGPHRVLLNKYYVDEIYDALFVRGVGLGGARVLSVFDRFGIDGLVNASGWLTRLSAWVSHAFDRHIVDGLVNLIGGTLHSGSFAFRRLQTGLIQNYALLMLFGVFAFLSIYLFWR